MIGKTTTYWQKKTNYYYWIIDLIRDYRGKQSSRCRLRFVKNVKRLLIVKWKGGCSVRVVVERESTLFASQPLWSIEKSANMFSNAHHVHTTAPSQVCITVLWKLKFTCVFLWKQRCWFHCKSYSRCHWSS